MSLDDAPTAEVHAPGSEKITDAHLQRLAMVYIRQSTAQQVLEHEESTRLQYGLVERARLLGWPEQRTLVIDDDLGKSGSSSEEREGFKRLVSEVGLDHVGIILGAETSRLARSNKDWQQLLEICALFGTLISDLDGVYDVTDYNDRMLLGLRGMMSEAELHLLKQRMHQGKINKARRGELSFPVPIGYVRRPSGEVVFDPDEEVQQVVSLVFRKFKELGTINAVLLYLANNGIKLGIRLREGEDKGELQWRRPNRSTLKNILHNPLYAGAYAYGRRQVDRRKKRGKRSPDQPTPGRYWVNPERWYVLLKERLPAYISWESYQENLRRMAENRSHADAVGAPRSGASLLQGLLVCGRCRQRMSVRYSEQGRHVYFCARQRMIYGGEVCQHVAGPPLDEFVTSKVLEALKPAALELSLAAAERLEGERTELDGLWRKRLERATYEAERAGRHYRRIEPENRLVARQLAEDWEHKLQSQRQLEEEYHRFQSEQPKVLSETERSAIRRLSEDIPALWEAQTTTNAERKEIIRQVLERIVVDVAGNSERVELHFEWAGATVTEGLMIRPVQKLEQLSYYPRLCERVRELAAEGLSAAEIAELLNEEGYRPPKRRERFSRQGIGQLMRRLALASGKHQHSHEQDESLGEDEWWLPELAAEIGMPEVTLYNWMRRGWVSARRGQKCSGRWIVRADEEELERLRILRSLPRGDHVRRKLWVERRKES